MLDSLLNGQVKSVTLLLWGLMALLYFLPAILSFLQAQRRFWIVLLLNVLVSPVQSAVLHFVAPSLLSTAGGNVVLLGLLANLGPCWLALIVWTLMPDARNEKIAAMQQGKLYDIVAALPLILWFGYGALQLRPTVALDYGHIADGSATLYIWVRAFSLTCAMLFDVLLVWLLVVRDKPVLRAKGLLPRACAIIGTFLGVGILQLPLAQLSLGMQLVAAVMVGIGSLASAWVVWRLGKSFSIMPEARVLVTSGAYSKVRHPLYAVEIITIIGTALQFAQPWAFLIGACVVAMLVIRTVYEERVLVEAYPEYVAYRAKTKRFIPGLI